MSAPRRAGGKGPHVPPPLRPYDPLIINAAITGMVPRSATVPAVPVTARQIVEDAVRCHQAGATILHLHARDANEAPDWRREAYAEFMPEIRARCPGVVLCVSTSGRTFGEFEKRADVLGLEGDAKPDMASLTLGSLNFRTEASVNTPDMIVRLAETMIAAGIRPELEIFDTGMVSLAAELADRGLLPGPLYANLLLGSVNTAPARARDLVHLVDSLPPGTVWAAAGIGAFQLPINAIAIFMGGHVRTGLEDNPHLDHRTRESATNELLVRRVAQLGELAQRTIATSRETREMLGLEAPAAP